jgi:hypothetical protein
LFGSVTHPSRIPTKPNGRQLTVISGADKRSALYGGISLRRCWLTKRGAWTNRDRDGKA